MYGSPNASRSINAWNVNYDGNLEGNNVDNDNNNGVRPVIEVLKSKLN